MSGHDRFHAPGDDHPQWSETSWYAFAIPERGLAGTIYPLFRRNLGTCSLGVYVWDAAAHEPWRVRYGRCLWHLPFPDGDLDDFRVGGLGLRCEEPLTRYRVRYEDAPHVSIDLVYEGLFPPHEAGVVGGRGHLDQPCRVRGNVELGGESLRVDGFEMRDRSWHVRDDARTTRAGYSYGISEQAAFLAMTMGGDAEQVVAGFLWQDGAKCDLDSGTRQVLERHPQHDYPTRVALDLRDREGRTLRAEGRCTSRLANLATPGMFAWMSLTEWEGSAGTATGEDQDIWSPDLLAARAGPPAGPSPAQSARA